MRGFRFWAFVLVVGTFAACSSGDGDGTAEPASSSTAPATECHRADCSLREVAAAAKLRVGTAVQTHLLSEEAPYRETVAREFNSITSENDMKWPFIHPSRNTYEFAAADAVVNFAEEHEIQVRGHTLLWGQTEFKTVPDYVANAVTADELRGYIDEHITTVVERYQERVQRWDVVNEPLDTLGPTLENNVFLRLMGKGYIAEAFQLAHRADPDAELWLNEAALELFPAKAQAFVDLAAELVAGGVPIHGVGLQTHLLGGVPDLDAFGALVKRLAGMGLEVAITEMDLAAGDEPDRFERQARGYGSTIASCLSVSQCREITFWGFTDRYTWLDDFLGPGRDPLLFDRDYQPKPAYTAVREQLALRR